MSRLNVDKFLPDLDILEEKAISHSLEGFSFSKDPYAFDETTLFRNDPHQMHDDDENEPFEQDFGGDAPMDVDDDGDHPPVEDFFVGDQAVGDDYVNEDAVSPEGFTGGENGSVDPETALGESSRPGTFVPFDPRRVPNERDLIMAMTEADTDNGGMMMDYFDQTFLKNWAGPEHWKLRKVVRRRKCVTRFVSKMSDSPCSHSHS